VEALIGRFYSPPAGEGIAQCPLRLAANLLALGVEVRDHDVCSTSEELSE
jgi:hypothetical protein